MSASRSARWGGALLLLLGCRAEDITSPDFLHCALPLSSPTPGMGRRVRVTVFGDSNVDDGFDADGRVVETSYISLDDHRLSPSAPNGRHQLAGKLEALSDPRDIVYRAVNHGAGGTGTGTNRHPQGSPSALLVWEGVTRFEAEVLGIHAPNWDGGEGRPRVQAYVPTPNDFAVIAMGTNDATGYGLPPSQTLINLGWMADRWIQAGQPSTHLIIATLPPRIPEEDSQVPVVNAGIRRLARERGLSLLDLWECTANPDGVNWRSSRFHVGDGVHYSEAVREWMARQIDGIVRTTP